MKEELSDVELWQQAEDERLEYEGYCNKIRKGLEELDEKSHQLRSKDSVIIERCVLHGFSAYELFQEFLLPECVKYNVPVTVTDTTIKVG